MDHLFAIHVYLFNVTILDNAMVVMAVNCNVVLLSVTMKTYMYIISSLKVTGVVVSETRITV
jgi:hypothetical protein